MQILYDRIRKDGIVRAGNVLKVDRFLNHQMDIHLFQEIGKEFKRRMILPSRRTCLENCGLTRTALCIRTGSLSMN